MDAALITQLIGSVGFPIACCIAMGYYVHEETNKQRDQISEIEKRHSDEMSSITEALNNNTLALQKLTDRLDMGVMKVEG
jgi:hypothetical protein